MTMTVAVLVPDEEGVLALGRVTGVRPVRYVWGDPLPPEAAEAEILVPAGRAPEWRGQLDQLPNLKLIQLRSAGSEDWIDVVPDGVLLSNARGAHGGSTAEWVMAVLLSMYRELGEFAAQAAEHRWQPRVTGTLQGKRALIIGAGDLGTQLRRRLEPFDVQVTMVAMTARAGVHSVDELPRLLPEHDIAVLMVPLTSRTRGMVDAAFLAAMPDGAVLVNAARGPVVDTNALLAELKTGRLRAALDVTDPEPLPADHPLWTAPGLLLTPHVGGAVEDVWQRAYSVVASEIARYVNGQPLRNLVVGEY